MENVLQGGMNVELEFEVKNLKELTEAIERAKKALEDVKAWEPEVEIKKG